MHPAPADAPGPGRDGSIPSLAANARKPAETLANPGPGQKKSVAPAQKKKASV